ncbi:hypothetical protein F4779DRAFT_616838 [Xylariaceae sp. FL0662B]|nr:hypothetical protein F4779DRAFT_616838 [Xylariaceae sp. FL0662B]
MSQLNDFLVQIPDRPNALSARMSNVAAHLSHNKVDIEAGRLVMAGPTLAHHPQTAEEAPPVTGSALLVRAGSESEVRRIIAENPYGKLGVWDLDKATVVPFRCMVRTPL